MTSANSPRAIWMVIITGAAFMMVTMGIRQSLGLFVSPLNTSTGLGIAQISFALAVGQFIWGAVQPVAGAFADRAAPGRVLVAGIVLLDRGHGAGAVHRLGGAHLCDRRAQRGRRRRGQLLGSDRRDRAQRLPAEKRVMAAGVINAGGSFGQFVFAPFAQA